MKNTEFKKRFFEKTARAAGRAVDHEGKTLLRPCLLWTAAVDTAGYGIFRISGQTVMGLPGGLYRAHRIAYLLANGPFPNKAQVDHICRNRICVEKSHLKILGPTEHARISNKDKYEKATPKT